MKDIKMYRMRNLISETKKPLLTWLAFIVIQQIIVASSSYWLVRLVSAISRGEVFQKYLGLYLLSLSLPYLPGMVARVFTIRWQYALIQTWSEHFIRRFHGRMAVWGDSKLRSEKEPYFISEGSKILSDYSEYTYMATANFFNVGLSLIVIVALLDKAFLFTYAFSIVVAAIYFLRQKPIQSKMSQQVQAQKAKLVSTLSVGWDNITIGNILNFNCWHNGFRADFDVVQASDQALQRKNQNVSVALAYLTLIPTMALIVMRMNSHVGDVVYLSSLAVLLPRFFMLLNGSSEVLRFASLWPSYRARLSSLLNALECDADISVESRINWSKLRFESNGDKVQVGSVAEVCELLSKPGRLTLRGENGAGKSSLFIALKQAIGEKAFVLPAHHQLRFEFQGGASTGQKLRAYLKEITTNDNSRVLLLDEWAANLDPRNLKELSVLVDELATSRAVLEIVH